MIDFNSSSVFKLKPVDLSEASVVKPMLVENEEIIAAFKTVRDKVIVTNKRIISANVQGITGSKTDYTSLPYSKIQAFSVETSGTFDRDCELELHFSSLGKVKFEILGNFDIISFSKILGGYIL